MAILDQVLAPRICKIVDVLPREACFGAAMPNSQASTMRWLASILALLVLFGAWPAAAAAPAARSPPAPPRSTAPASGEDAFARGDAAFEDDNYDQAMTWYRKAADQGFAEAMHAIGLLYDDGLGVPEDSVQAMNWYRKAADHGFSDDQQYMGDVYYYGRGVPRDYAQAMAWYRKAADQGRAQAQNKIGVLYQRGLGVPYDYAQAIIWFHKAADQGFAEARKNIDDMHDGARLMFNNKSLGYNCSSVVSGFPDKYDDLEHPERAHYNWDIAREIADRFSSCVQRLSEGSSWRGIEGVVPGFSLLSAPEQKIIIEEYKSGITDILRQIEEQRAIISNEMNRVQESQGRMQGAMDAHRQAAAENRKWMEDFNSRLAQLPAAAQQEAARLESTMRGSTVEQDQARARRAAEFQAVLYETKADSNANSSPTSDKSAEGKASGERSAKPTHRENYRLEQNRARAAGSALDGNYDSHGTDCYIPLNENLTGFDSAEHNRAAAESNARNRARGAHPCVYDHSNGPTRNTSR